MRRKVRHHPLVFFTGDITLPTEQVLRGEPGGDTGIRANDRQPYSVRDVKLMIDKKAEDGLPNCRRPDDVAGGQLVSLETPDHHCEVEGGIT